ncbi:nitroreductase family deazaflavin-dependent oxidoreductase [Streptomyces sp. NPDC059506]|uniref:nitroreductase family deazaflavin-dependent oxidoreductase n=1 Tax=Streptomyces sp. NPDC059506 TaxID=3347751 RepID=UPI0036A19528
MTASHASHYRRPGLPTLLLNRIVRWVNGRGIGLAGSKTLAVRGRTSGEWRTTPVNPLEFDGRRYLVSPRGHSQWVRNMRAAGGGELRLGRKAEAFTAVEVPDADKPELLRAYLRRWQWEVGALFDGVGPDSPDEELLRIASSHPVFRITPSR